MNEKEMKPEVKAAPQKARNAECIAFYGRLGGKRYSRGEVVKLNGTLETEARKNPTVWRLF